MTYEFITEQELKNHEIPHARTSISLFRSYTFKINHNGGHPRAMVITASSQAELARIL